ncbi:MAG TPA: T9SS type A sorting domain-containing protein [Chitinophagaceae bacterium]|nr:T9SS type A sorting domain-containing protein [Chitinophagaceae bacterium]
MKKALLSLALMSSILLVRAQMVLPLSYDFDDGQAPAGWETSAQVIGVEAYSAMMGGSCQSNAGGLYISPNAGSSGNNRTGFTTPMLGFVSTSAIVRVEFDLFAYNQNQLTCANQVMTSCNAMVKVYVVSSDYNGTGMPSAGQILGQSPNTTIMNNMRGQVDAPVTATVGANTTFKLMIDASTADCDAKGAIRYVIDNVRFLITDQIVTPVTMKSFTAKRNNGAVALNWVTASEQDNKGFNVQRNIGGEWKTIAFVPSSANGGNSSTDLSYSFTDANNERGISQYRLQQVNFDGKFSYSDIRAIRGDGVLAKMIIYPNPSPTGTINVVFEDGNAIRDVLVNDAQGRVVKQHRAITNNILVIEHLTKGFYTIRVSNRTTGASGIEKVVVK